MSSCSAYALWCAVHSRAVDSSVNAPVAPLGDVKAAYRQKQVATRHRRLGVAIAYFPSDTGGVSRQNRQRAANQWGIAGWDNGRPASTSAGLLPTSSSLTRTSGASALRKSPPRQTTSRAA